MGCLAGASLRYAGAKGALWSLNGTYPASRGVWNALRNYSILSFSKGRRLESSHRLRSGGYTGVSREDGQETIPATETQDAEGRQKKPESDSWMIPKHPCGEKQLIE